MSQPACPDCGGAPETVRVSTGERAFFVICQAETHRRSPDRPGLTMYGKILSNGHDAPAKAEADWKAEHAKKFAPYQ